MTPKKPTQLPDGALSDAVGTHDEAFVNDDQVTRKADDQPDNRGEGTHTERRKDND